MMNVKRTLAGLLVGALLVLCGCAGGGSGNGTPGGYDLGAAAEMRDQRYVYLTLWSWQITNEKEAEAYAEKALECGFTAVDFAVLWSAFEPLKGHFDWTYLDGVMNVFANKGLKVSLQPLLWTKDLSWAGELELQQKADGTPYRYEGRGGALCLTHAETVATVKHTLQAFALHATGYGAILTRWGVRLNPFGEWDYPINEDLDYSPSARRAFYDWLKDEYGTWSALSQARGLGVSSRGDLEALPMTEVVDSCADDWRRFRQDILLEVSSMISGIFRSADGTVPILFHLGTFGNGMNAAYSGVVDLWTVAHTVDFDILGLSFCDGADPGMILSFASSLTSKDLSVEVDGAWALDEGRNIASQVALCGRFGVFSLGTANFTLEQLSQHQSLLLTYPGLFSSRETVGDADPSKAVLVLPGISSSLDSPRSFDALYGSLWSSWSEGGTRRVRFVTEGQLASGEVSLDGITQLNVGDGSGEIPVDGSFVSVLRSSGVSIVGKISFVPSGGSSVSEEDLQALNDLISKE